MFEILEIPKEKIKVFGKEFDVEKPSVHSVMVLQTKLKDIKEDSVETFNIMCDWIGGLGIDSEVVKQLKVNQLTMLIEHLTDSKKN